MAVQPELPPDPVRQRRRKSRMERDEIHALVEEFRRQNQLLRRYLFLFGAALAVLLLLQFEAIKQFLNYLMVVAIVLAILLTAPWWSRMVVLITDRIPWYPRSPRK